MGFSHNSAARRTECSAPDPCRVGAAVLQEGSHIGASMSIAETDSFDDQRRAGSLDALWGFKED